MSYSIYIEAGVRTYIELDYELIAEAMAMPTKQATVEEALRVLRLQHRRKTALANFAGLGWEGDLEAMREGRVDDPAK